MEQNLEKQPEKAKTNIPRGDCPICGMTWYGWSLMDPEYQVCDNCGADLQITMPKGDKCYV